MDDKAVKLRVASMPGADKFQLHIYAALAEQERSFISERAKAALRAAKARGAKLGGLRDTTMKCNLAVQVKPKIAPVHRPRQLLAMPNRGAVPLPIVADRPLLQKRGGAPGH